LAVYRSIEIAKTPISVVLLPQELKDLLKKFNVAGVAPLADIVINHR